MNFNRVCILHDFSNSFEWMSTKDENGNEIELVITTSNALTHKFTTICAQADLILIHEKKKHLLKELRQHVADVKIVICDDETPLGELFERIFLIPADNEWTVIMDCNDDLTSCTNKVKEAYEQTKKRCDDILTLSHFSDKYKQKYQIAKEQKEFLHFLYQVISA